MIDRKEVPEEGSNQHISNAKYLKSAFLAAPLQRDSWADTACAS